MRFDTTAWGCVLAIVLVLWPVVSSGQEADGDNEVKEPFVNKIVFIGNTRYSDKQLRQQMYTKETTFFSIFRKPRLRREFLSRDIASLEAFYHANGYLEAEVELQKIEPVDKAFVNVVIEIRENEPTVVADIQFLNPGELAPRQLMKGLLLVPGEPYNPSLLSIDMLTIKKQYFERGHADVTVSNSVRVVERSVHIQYTIDPGPVFNVNNVRIRGNQSTKTGIIEKEIAIRSGDMFRLSKIVETQTNLFETGLFREAEVLPTNLSRDDQSVDILVRVVERKSAYIEVGFGVGNIKGSRVVAEWGDRNVLGRGRRLRARVEYSYALFQDGSLDLSYDHNRVLFYRYEAEFNQRHLFGTKVLLGLSGFLEKDATVENVVIKTVGAWLSGNRRLSQNSIGRLLISTQYIDSETLLGDEQSQTNFIQPSVLHDTRDFVLDPKRGNFRDLAVTLAGGILGGDNDFYGIGTTLQRYFAVGSGGTIVAARVRLAYADAYGSSAYVPIENRYFTGGSNSIRGYKENTIAPVAVVTDTTTGATQQQLIGGERLVITNVELRFPLPLLARWRFSGAIFTDSGNSWKSPGTNLSGNLQLTDITQWDYQVSVGLGIRYNTPIGPIRLDYGIPLTTGPQGDSFGRFHISLGQIF